MIYTDEAAEGGGLWLPKTVRDLIADAQGKLGTTDIDWHFEDWTLGVANYDRVVGAGGFAGVVNNDRFGVARVATGAGSGTSSALHAGNANGYPAHIKGGTGATWYIASRQSIESGITDVGDYAALQGWNSATGDQLWLGARQQQSTTKFCLRGTGNAGAGIVSNVAFTDTLKHVLKAWRVGGTTSLSVDGETPVTGNVFPTDDCGFKLGADNAAASAREVQEGYHFIAWLASDRVVL